MRAAEGKRGKGQRARGRGREKGDGREKQDKKSRGLGGLMEERCGGKNVAINTVFLLGFKRQEYTNKFSSFTCSFSFFFFFFLFFFHSLCCFANLIPTCLSTPTYCLNLPSALLFLFLLLLLLLLLQSRRRHTRVLYPKGVCRAVVSARGGDAADIQRHEEAL